MSSIVGGGPAGLAAAIRLKQLATEKGSELSVCLIEKGAEIGAHILSGAVMDPRALNELLPDWKEAGAPLNAPVSEDRFFILSETGATQVPNSLLPGCFHNEGNYVISPRQRLPLAGRTGRGAGRRDLPGFAGAEVLFDENGAVKGVATGDMGRLHDGSEGPNFQPGMELLGKYTFFAEGCRGHLGKQLMEKFDLTARLDPQTYGIGLKELWEIQPDKHQLGLVIHSGGWPMDSRTPTAAASSITWKTTRSPSASSSASATSNPHLSPFEEFQRYKTHPEIRKFLEGGKRLAYGARAIDRRRPAEPAQADLPGRRADRRRCRLPQRRPHQGLALPRSRPAPWPPKPPSMPWPPNASTTNSPPIPEAFKNSWLHDELYKARNFKPLDGQGPEARAP